MDGWLPEGVIARFGFPFWRWSLGLGVAAVVATGLSYPLPVCACVTAGEVVAGFADEATDAPAEAIEGGLALRLATWQYTFALLPPDLRRFCEANEFGSVDCRVVTHAAPLRERGLEIRLEEDGQGFLGVVHVQPFERWRMGEPPWPR